MAFIPARIRESPALVRAFPFAVFVLLTALQPYAGASGRYWIYLAKTVVVAVLIWNCRHLIPEMRWNFSWEAVVVGIVVFVVWVKLGDFTRALGLGAFGEWKLSGPSSDPRGTFGTGSALVPFFLAVRVIGSTVVVPPMEEVFFRSLAYRYLIRPDFQSVQLGQFVLMPFVVTSLAFGFEHREWLAGILCGFAYQGLVLWKKRLGDAITAHAITNALLGCWVISRDEWQFW
jgi:CAAX prenyl protease-like protein